MVSFYLPALLNNKAFVLPFISEFRHFVILIVPLLLIPSTALTFTSLSKRLGKDKGYLLGFLFYWGFWCLIVPLALLGWNDFLKLFVDSSSLFSERNRLAAALFIMVTLVTFFMYGKDFVQAPLTLILIAIPLATVNGICEEILWRGCYVGLFPHNFWLAIPFPALGFALWHLVPLRIFSVSDKYSFVLSTFFLGLAYGWIAYSTASARWTAISHSLNGILSLGGMIAPVIFRLLRR
jgi:hypothetical protein